MTLPGGVGTAAAVLAVVFVIGVLAGRAKRRWTLLLTGLVVMVGAGMVVVVSRGAAAARAQEYAEALSTVLPLGVAYLAGWLCGRGTWFKRLLVVAAAALLLAAFPYAAAGEALVRLIPA